MIFMKKILAFDEPDKVDDFGTVSKCCYHII
jgi:hypothetical protein